MAFLAQRTICEARAGNRRRKEVRISKGGSGWSSRGQQRDAFAHSRGSPRHSPETAPCGVLGPFEPHADAQVVEVDWLPLSRISQHPGQVFDQRLDGFAARAFADGLRVPRAEIVIGAIEVDLDDDELRIIRIFAIIDAHRLIAPIARAWLGFVVVAHTVAPNLLMVSPLSFPVEIKSPDGDQAWGSDEKRRHPTGQREAMQAGCPAQAR